MLGVTTRERNLFDGKADEETIKKDSSKLFFKMKDKYPDPISLVSYDIERYRRLGLKFNSYKGMVTEYLGKEFALMKDLFSYCIPFLSSLHP